MVIKTVTDANMGIKNDAKIGEMDKKILSTS